jgi:hypothetical protein
MAAKVYTGTLSLNELSPSEQTLKEIAITKRTAIRSIWIYLGNLTVGAILKFYKKDNGGSYREVPQLGSEATTVGGGMFELFVGNGGPIETVTDIKVTMTSVGSGAGSVDVTYEIDYDDVLDEVEDTMVNGASRIVGISGAVSISDSANYLGIPFLQGSSITITGTGNKVIRLDGCSGSCSISNSKSSGTLTIIVDGFYGQLFLGGDYSEVQLRGVFGEFNFSGTITSLSSYGGLYYRHQDGGVPTSETNKAVIGQGLTGSVDFMNIGDAATILARLGAWTGTGINTVLGAFKALLSKVASLPSDIGGTGDPATDSNEAIRERVDTVLVATGTPTGYAPSTATRTIGSDQGGTVSDLAAHDDTTFGTGENASTGLEVDIVRAASTITERPSVLRVTGYYNGSVGHQVDVQIYNYILAAYQTAGVMLSRTAAFDYSFPLSTDHHDLSTGEMKVKFKHNVTTYNASHRLYLDWVSWEKVEANSQIMADLAAVRVKTDQLEFSLAGKVDSNLKAIEGALTDDYNATLKLRAIEIINSGTPLMIVSTAGHALYVNGADKGLFVLGGTGNEIQAVTGNNNGLTLTKSGTGKDIAASEIDDLQASVDAVIERTGHLKFKNENVAQGGTLSDFVSNTHDFHTYTFNSGGIVGLEVGDTIQVNVNGAGYEPFYVSSIAEDRTYIGIRTAIGFGDHTGQSAVSYFAGEGYKVEAQVVGMDANTLDAAAVKADAVTKIQAGLPTATSGLSAQAKLDVNAEVDSALNTAIPVSPAANSINERIKAIDARLPGLR